MEKNYLISNTYFFSFFGSKYVRFRPKNTYKISPKFSIYDISEICCKLDHQKFSTYHLQIESEISDIYRKLPIYFVGVLWSHLEHNLSDIIPVSRKFPNIYRKFSTYYQKFSTFHLQIELECRCFLVRLEAQLVVHIKSKFFDIQHRKFPTHFVNVFWSDLEHNLSDIISRKFPIYIKNFQLILLVFFGSNRTYFGLNKLKKHVLQIRLPGYTTSAHSSISRMRTSSISRKSYRFAHAKSSDDQPLLWGQDVSFLNHGLGVAN